MNNQHFDCIVVGQGLAGTCFSFELIRRNKNVMVIDHDRGAKCSSVAAGTFNPLVFKSFTPTWMAPILVPYLNTFYNELSSLLGLSLLNERSVVKSMKSVDQRRLWESMSADLESGPFMKDDVVENVPGIHSTHGFGFVKGSGNIDMPTLLEGFRLWLGKKGALIEEVFDYDALSSFDTHVEYKGIKADRIIFCQGHENSMNPFFSYLPFIPAKGEILIIESPQLKSRNIIHDRINIVPLKGDNYWVGSTFTWDNLNLEKTEEARINLENQLKEILQVPFKVVDHMVGIRPTVKDRRPILGMHSENGKIGVFNGLGTRGIMLAPYFANHFANHIYNGVKLNSVVDIARFNAKG